MKRELDGLDGMTVVVQFTPQAGRMLEDLVARGLHGATVSQAVARIVETRLQEYAGPVVLELDRARPCGRSSSTAVVPGPESLMARALRAGEDVAQRHARPFVAPVLERKQREIRQRLHELVGDLADRVAHDLDHGNKAHPAWWRAVKRGRRVLERMRKPKPNPNRRKA